MNKTVNVEIVVEKSDFESGGRTFFSQLMARPELMQVGLLAFAWYAAWLAISAAIFHPILDLTFNSMFDHLMHGRFDVDPTIVGFEGYARGGRIYAYWGIWCALLRLPLWLVHRLDFDMTAISSLVAVCIACVMKLRTVFLIERHSQQNVTTRAATNFMAIYVLFGASEGAYLKVSIYQEVVFWAYAFATIFVYLTIKGILKRHFDLPTLFWMSLCAGFAVLTRVSTGVGLTASFGLILFIVIGEAAKSTPGSPGAIHRWMNALFNRRFLIPIMALLACLVGTGIVNYLRWGNPLTFVNLSLCVGLKDWPDRLVREATYGAFNLSRIPYGLMYYFFPLWIIHQGGHLLFEGTQFRLMDIVELPPGSFFLTELLPFAFIAFLVRAVWRRRTASLPSPISCAAVFAGLLCPCILMLMAVAMTYRYRMEFYPEIDFLAFIGLFLVLKDAAIQAEFARNLRWVKAALAVSILFSIVMQILYMHAQFGPAQDAVRQGLF